MTKVLILGANGQIARVAVRLFLDQTDAQLTLDLRNARRLKEIGHQERVRIVEGDVLDAKTLGAAMAGQDCVYANLSGRMEEQARGIVVAMREAGVKRLIFISSMGIYGEVPASATVPYSILTGFCKSDRGLRSRLHDHSPRMAERPRRNRL